MCPDLRQVHHVLEHLLDVADLSAAVRAALEARFDLVVDVFRTLLPRPLVSNGPTRLLLVLLRLVAREGTRLTLPLPLPLHQLGNDALEFGDLSLELLDANVSGVALVGHGRRRRSSSRSPRQLRPIAKLIAPFAGTDRGAIHVRGSSRASVWAPNGHPLTLTPGTRRRH